MKKVVLILFMTLFVNYSFSQGNGMFMITEKFNNYYTVGTTYMPPDIDSVFVTSPTGIVTKYSIPHYLIDIENHDRQLNSIINNIISQGYKILEKGDWMYGYADQTQNPIRSYYLRTLFFGAP